MGLCYLELNAALGTGLGTDWPVTVDHGSTMETSWAAALAPDLVETAALPDDPAAAIVGVYGPNPRFTVDGERGAAQIDAAAGLLAERAAARLRGEVLDPLADLRTLRRTLLARAAELSGRAGGPAVDDGAVAAAIGLTNPSAVSRYLAGLALRLDGVAVPADGMALVNPTVGEAGVALPVADLGPECGFYVRRQQTALLRLPVAVAPGPMTSS